MKLPRPHECHARALRRGETRSHTLLIILCTILVLVAGGAGYYWWHEYQEAEEAKRPDPKDRSAAIVLPEKGLTNASVRAIIQPWLEKTWQAEGLKDADAELIPAEKWKAFVRALLAEELEGPGALAPVELERLATDLVPLASSHPVAAAVVAHALPEHKSRYELLSLAWDAFSKEPGMEHLAWLVACDLAMTETPDNVTRESLIKKLTSALRKMLEADEGLSRHHDQIAAWILFGGVRKDFYGLVHDEVWPVLEKSPKLKPWLKLWAEGQHRIHLAWEARGGGYSDSVTRRGRTVYEAELERAETILKEAWKLKPEHAGPAVSLCYAGLRGGKNTAPGLMRKWFNEAVKVHLDHPEAYRHILWGLRPRWYGSHEKMAAFGLACLETERFDTDVPFIYLLALSDAAGEWNLPDYFWIEFRHHDYLKQLFDGYEKSPSRAEWRRHDRTVAAVIFYKCTQYEEARKWLDKLEFKPDPRVIASMDIDEKLFLGKVAACTSSQGKKVRDGEQALLKFDPARAVELYQAVLKNTADLTGEGRNYVEACARAADFSAKFKNRETVPLISGNNLLGWTKFARDAWKISADGKALEMSGIRGQSMISHLAMLGSRLVVSGEFEIEEPGAMAEVALTFGYPLQGPWSAVRFAFLEDGNHVLLSSRLDEVLTHTELDRSAAYSFELKLERDFMTLTIEGQTVWDKETVPKGTVMGEYTRFGLVGVATSAQTKVRFTKLEIRKL